MTQESLTNFTVVAPGEDGMIVKFRGVEDWDTIEVQFKRADGAGTDTKGPSAFWIWMEP